MKKSKFLLLLGTVFSTVACNSGVSALRGANLLREPSKTTKAAFNSKEYDNFKEKLKTFSNKFSETYLSQAYEDGKNLTISPLSLEMCLGLAVCGSSGETRQEILNAFDIDYETFKKYYKGFYWEFNESRKSENNEPMFDISNTNSIWIDEDVALLDSGLDELKDDYYCYSYKTDFKKDKAGEQISAFIEQESKGLLKPELHFNPLTLFVLMNTLYLKDIWNMEGDNLEFSEDPEHYFTNSDNKISTKKLLKSYYSAGRAIKTDDYSGFYTKTCNGFKIYFVKPNEGKELKNVFNKETMDYVLGNNYITEDNVNKEWYFTRCIFPEFEGDCDTELKDILSQNFNIRSLFDSDHCNFSNLTDEKVYCEGVTQIAKLEVNKKGIEGAAVTFMPVCGEAMRDDEEPYTSIYEDFLVDKEFGYILTYKDSVVFSGVVTNIDK